MQVVFGLTIEEKFYGHTLPLRFALGKGECHNAAYIVHDRVSVVDLIVVLRVNTFEIQVEAIHHKVGSRLGVDHHRHYIWREADGFEHDLVC